MGRILDQIDKDLVIQEALYGFVMALTFTTATQLGLYQMSRVALVTAIVMMDFVWGAIDLVIFFDIDVIAHRRRTSELRRVCRDKPDDSREVLSGLLEGTVFDEVDEESREKAVDLLCSAGMQDRKTLRRDWKRYFFNAVTAFAVTLSTAIPSALCVILIDDLWLACLMAAMMSCIALLFIGYLMAVSEKKINRLMFGLFIAGLTMLLTLFAAVFGG